MKYRYAAPFAVVLAIAACNIEDDPSGGILDMIGENGEQGSRCDRGPAPGCPCDEEGERVICNDVYSQVGDQVVCGMGDSVCTDGVYAECIINNTITLAVDDDSSAEDEPSAGTETLGPPTDCNNPCDPSCNTYVDDKVGESDPANGIVENDDGLTLPGAPGLVQTTCSGGTSGTCAHSICQTGSKLKKGCDAKKSGEPSCVTSICAQKPACCTGAWDSSCTALLNSVCKVSCFADQAGACFACYGDSYDHDGDGYAGNNGDCLDCDTKYNAGAYDFPGNGADENCDGTADNEVEVCDAGLAMGSTNPKDFVKAMDLCREAKSGVTGPAKTWGVLTQTLVQANGTSAPHARGYGIHASFGTNNAPLASSRFAAFSSGTARAPGQTGYVNPNGQFASYNANTQCNFPSGFPKNAGGCPVGTGNAYDSSGLKMKIRVPTNAKSFSYSFNYMTSEYPEWVCTAFNDHFVALLTGSTATPANPSQNSSNISFDQNSNPVSVNIGFFTEPSCPTCASALLSNTGFDGTCQGKSCGGGTGWLYSSAPVVGGQEITMHLSTWDQGDHVWDSTVLVDYWRWSGETTSIKTGVQQEVKPTLSYAAGNFVRDYDATGLCPQGTSVVWGHWSWQALAPSDAYISFAVRTAPTNAGLDIAPQDPLLFSDPPGPATLVGTPAIAAQGNTDTRNGSLVVDESLADAGRSRVQPFLRVVSSLHPSTDLMFAPTLTAWNLQVTCQESE